MSGQGPTLRRGWTTGTCAAGAAKAAFSALSGSGFPDPVEIRLPRGGTASLALAERRLGACWAEAGIVKDAGDDPDVTHGCLVLARIEPGGRGISFRAGPGVGTVTRPGLALPPGEPAINPVPRRVIEEALAEVAEATGAALDLAVTVSIPGGEAIAARTLNPRLGIVGGLSILGTTGVVVPFSCAAWIHSIHRGIDVARASGLRHVAAATGSTSERAVQQLFDLPDVGLIEMGDFAGATLKYLRRHPVARVTIAGGFGKLVKLAQGALDLHSARSRVDLVALAATAGALGGDDGVRHRIEAANTAGEALAIAAAADLPLGAAVAHQAKEVASAAADHALDIEIVVFDRDGRLVGRA